MGAAVARVLHLSDVHYCLDETIPGVDPVYNLATLFGELVDRGITVDACVLTGDVTHNGDPAEYERLKVLLNSVPWPTRVVPGNHDSSKVMKSVLGEAYLPNEGVWTWRITGALSLIGLDSSVEGYHHGSLSPESLTALEAQARIASKRGDWLVALHHPPVDVGHWWMDAQGLHGGRAELLEIADEHGALAVLCGHLHMTCLVQRRRGTPVLVAPSTAHEVVYDDGLERPLRFRRRSPRALLHAISDSQITSIELTSGGSSHLVESHPWLDEVRRTNNRGPAPKRR